jgi:hypothetical protein
MAFFGLLGKKKKSTTCCPCFGGAPSFRCACHCHRVMDVEFWETVAYAWLCDAPDERARYHAWKRFLEAYPQYAHESHEVFWNRIHHTQWHRKHHKEHHHTPYS